MDTAHKNSIILMLADSRVLTFEPSTNGLYCQDTNTVTGSNKSKQTVTNYSLSQTVKDSKSYFTAQEIKGADMSRELQKYAYYPSTTIVKDYINNNLIHNCIITADDVNKV